MIALISQTEPTSLLFPFTLTLLSFPLADIPWAAWSAWSPSCRQLICDPAQSSCLENGTKLRFRTGIGAGQGVANQTRWRERVNCSGSEECTVRCEEEREWRIGELTIWMIWSFILRINVGKKPGKLFQTWRVCKYRGMSTQIADDIAGLHLGHIRAVSHPKMLGEAVCNCSNTCMRLCKPWQ